MSRQALTRASLICRATRRSLQAQAPSIRTAVSVRRFSHSHSIMAHRAFSTASLRMKGIMPETDNPQKEEVEPTQETWAVVELDEDKYHEIADIYLEKIVTKFEEMQDQQEGVDVEYASGVLSISMIDKGTYVINKQPPNKQIWLSSPITGPKRFDYCMSGEGQNDKEGSGEGRWIYSRDGSSLSDIIHEELGVDVELLAPDQA